MDKVLIYTSFISFLAYIVLSFLSTDMMCKLLKEVYPVELEKYKTTWHFRGGFFWDEIKSVEPWEKKAFIYPYHIYSQYKYRELSEKAKKLDIQLTKISKVIMFLLIYISSVFILWGLHSSLTN